MPIAKFVAFQPSLQPLYRYFAKVKRRTVWGKAWAAKAIRKEILTKSMAYGENWWSQAGSNR
jgi:hypothetical protein